MQSIFCYSAFIDNASYHHCQDSDNYYGSQVAILTLLNIFFSRAFFNLSYAFYLGIYSSVFAIVTRVDLVGYDIAYYRTTPHFLECCNVDEKILFSMLCTDKTKSLIVIPALESSFLIIAIHWTCLSKAKHLA